MFWRRDRRGTTLAEIPQGFRIRRAFFPWGTTAAEVTAALRLAGDDDGPGFRHIAARCAGAYGFDTAAVSLSAPGQDRPVTAASYELAQPRGGPLPDPAQWMDPLGQALGAPAEAARHDVPSGADPSGCVRYSARWELGAHAVGLSVYGGPRAVRHGVAAGCLWLSWSDLAAAAPFLADWRMRAADLAQRAAAPTALHRFRLGVKQGPAVAANDPLHREASCALNAPDLLPTPLSLAVDSRSIALWQADDAWGLSTAWDSIMLRAGERVTVRRIEVLPAKGGGASQLEVGSWRVRDFSGSAAIAAAAAAIAALPGVRLDQVETYDC